MASYTTLRIGSKGDEVTKLQKALGITADGIYGKKTEAAVKDYQSKNGLTVDGIAGNNTLGSLYSTKTTKTTTKKDTPKLKGVDQNTMDTMTSSFKQSNKVSGLESEKNKIKETFNDYALNTDIIDQSIYDTLKSQFVVPEAVTQADAYLTSQLEKIQSGRTSWSDDVESMIDMIKNRDKFEYDVDNDQLFQQALASAMNSGKTAMQDTIGQASALTGGYGSTYATSAGNQAYNSFIEDAYNNLPEYYQMALSAYQAEGEDMYRQLGMYMDADATEYGRMVDAYNVTADHRNTLYNEAYSLWRDGKTDAYNIGNLQLSENNQIVSNLYNAYNVSSNEYENAYAKEFQTWESEVNKATNLAQLLNSDYWSQTNFDEGVRQFNETMEYNKSKGSEGSGAGAGGSGKLSNGAAITSMSTYKQKALAAYNEGGDEALDTYVDSLGLNETEKAEIGMYVYGGKDADGNEVEGNGNLPLYMQTFTKTNDTTNWFWGVDNNDEVTDQNGKAWKLSELKKQLKSDGVDSKIIDKILGDLTGLGKNKTYTYSKN